MTRDLFSVFDPVTPKQLNKTVSCRQHMVQFALFARLGNHKLTKQLILQLLLLEQTAPNTAPTGSVYHATSPALNLALKSLTSVS